MANKRIKKRLQSFCAILLLLKVVVGSFAQQQPKQPARLSRALVLFEDGGHHKAFTDAAQPWLTQFALQHHFKVDFFTKVDTLSDSLLDNYQLIIQLDYVPYGWPERAQNAFVKYITEGRGGWVGLHHASLLGDFDGHTMWPWFHEFIGGIRFKNYIPAFAAATVVAEKKQHPVLKGVPATFAIEKEEWYTYDMSPRKAVNVIASVNESSYKPSSDIKMGDHPVIWSNEKVKAKNVYIFMGHSPDLLQNKAFVKILSNAILWAGN